MKYKPGNKIKVRPWNEMVEEFGLKSDKVAIDCKHWGFLQKMRHTCCNLITIETVIDNHYFVKENPYIYTDEMLEEYLEELEMPREIFNPDNTKNAINNLLVTHLPPSCTIQKLEQIRDELFNDIIIQWENYKVKE